MAALFLAGCGSAGAAVRALRSQSVQTAQADAHVKRAPTTAEPVITPLVANGFDFLYRFITEAEFVLCLEGSVSEGQLHIDGFRLAQIEASTVNSVRYQPCRGYRYLGTAHNHPPANRPDLCARSDADRRSFASDSLAVVDIVLCGPDRYAWVMKDGRSGTVTLPYQPEPRAKTIAARTK